MAQSKARSVSEYLSELPPHRRGVVSAVRDTVRRNLPKGYRETTNFGMITWELPLERYPETYNGQPLCYAGLAAHKNHYALYLMGAYSNPDDATKLRDAFRKSGKKMDMGKSCLRFQRAEDLPLHAIGQIIKGTPPEKFIEQYEASRKAAGRARPKAARAATTKRKSPAPRRTSPRA